MARSTLDCRNMGVYPHSTYPRHLRWWNYCCCFIYVMWRWALRVVIKRLLLHLYFSTLAASEVQILPVLKPNGHYVGFLFPVSILAILLSLAFDSTAPHQIGDEFTTSYRFSKMEAGHSVANLLLVSGFVTPVTVTHLGSKSICITNFGKLFQSTAETLLLPVSGNKRPL